MARAATSALAVGAAVAVAAAFGAVGADSRWLAALGHEIVMRGGVPDGVPFATAPSADWPNVLVLAQLLFDAFDVLGERGFLLAQLAAVAIGFAVLAHDARRGGATDSATAIILLAVAAGAFTAISVVRLQLFSLALFPIVLFLLRSETRYPSRRIWLLVPLIALWGNLHGAVLAGLAVAGAYLVFERARLNPVEALGVAVASTLALAANPALLRTVAYYHGVLTNEAARRGFGLWEPLRLGSPFDVVLIVVAAAVVFFALRSRPHLWEIVALIGLTVMTVRTARTGVWLLFASAGPAARALPALTPPRRTVTVAIAFALAALIGIGMARGPRPTGATRPVLETAIEAAGTTPILAEALAAEQVALAGGTVWISNPLDAFPPDDQRLYLDWLEAAPTGDAAVRLSRIVLVRAGGDVERRLRAQHSVTAIARDERIVAYVVRDG